MSSFQYIDHSRFSLGFRLSVSYGTEKVTYLMVPGHLHWVVPTAFCLCTQSLPENYIKSSTCMIENKLLLMANGISDLSLLYVPHFTCHKNPMSSVLPLSLFLGEMSKVKQILSGWVIIWTQMSHLLALCCLASYSNHLQGSSMKVLCKR